jgi:hypothetical protein
MFRQLTTLETTTSDHDDDASARAAGRALLSEKATGISDQLEITTEAGTLIFRIDMLGEIVK